MTQHTYPPLPEPARTEVYATARNSSSVRKGFEMGGYIKEPAYYTAEQMHAYADAVRAQAMEEIGPLRLAGAQLANCAFNLAQREPGQFTERDIEALHRSRKDWDAAIRALAHPTKQGGGT